MIQAAEAEMTRGGRLRDRDKPERRCIVTGESGPTGPLIRFALSPDGEVVPDISGRLPGRGAWVTAERALIDKAVARRLFARAFKAQVAMPEGLADLVEALLARRLVDTISLARKAGQAVMGFEKVRARLTSGQAAILIQAIDGSERGKEKLAGPGADIPRIQVLTAAEMGLAFGREFAIHAALDAGGFATRVLAEAGRLRGLRSGSDGQAGQGLAAGTADTASGSPEGDVDGRGEPACGSSRQGDR